MLKQSTLDDYRADVAAIARFYKRGAWPTRPSYADIRRARSHVTTIAAITAQPVTVYTGRSKNVQRAIKRSHKTPQLRGLKGIFVPVPHVGDTVNRFTVTRDGQLSATYSTRSNAVERLVVAVPTLWVVALGRKNTRVAASKKIRALIMRTSATAVKRGFVTGNIALARGFDSSFTSFLNQQGGRKMLANEYIRVASHAHYADTSLWALGVSYTKTSNQFAPPDRSGERRRLGRGAARTAIR